MDELRKSAIRSAFEFNSEMNTIKRTERRYFWDLQTSVYIYMLLLNFIELKVELSFCAKIKNTSIFLPRSFNHQKTDGNGCLQNIHGQDPILLRLFMGNISIFTKSTCFDFSTSLPS